jgi:hypothetical protein
LAIYGLARLGADASEEIISTPGGRGRATDEREDAATLRLCERPSGEGGGESARE